MSEFRDYTNSGNFRDFARVDDEFYESSSALSSRENESALSDMKERVESSATWAKDDYSFLALKSDSGVYGHTLPFHGIVNIHPKLLAPEAQRIGYAVAVHERVHLHTGGSLRREVFSANPEVDRHFHEVVIPLWRAGKITIPTGDRGFIIHKEWTSLYNEWDGVKVEFDHAAKTLKKYYWLLERGFLRTDEDGNLDHQMDPERFKDYFEQQEAVNIQQQFENNPQRYLKHVVTGYDFGNYLFEKQRNQIERDYKLGLWENEEGLANFIGTEIAGVSKEELKAAVRQDEGKYFLVDKLKAKYEGKIKELLANTVDYQHFAEVLQSLK